MFNFLAQFCKFWVFYFFYDSVYPDYICSMIRAFLKNLSIDVEIFFMATFGGYDFWRVKYADGGISKNVDFRSAINIEIHNHGSYCFIDYHYARGFFN